jgi:hypothetical protein
MGLLYFLPGEKRSITPERVAELGLGYAFEGRHVANDAFDGPEGKPGAVLVADATRTKLGFYKDRQTWRPVPGTTAWVGRYTDEPVEPKDLQRRDALRGHWVTLADGQAWLVPVARGATERDGELVCFVELPQYTEIDDAGEWVEGAIVPRYAALWDHATAWWDTLRAQGQPAEESSDEPGDAPAVPEVKFDFPGLHEAALAALAANYRIGRAEAALLQLFTKQSATSVLKALVDWPTVEEFLKKKFAGLAVGSPIDAGPAAASPAIDRPLPT